MTPSPTREREGREFVSLLNAVFGLAWSLFFLALHLVLFWGAIKHRHDSSGIVWALLFLAEQIHMKPGNPFTEAP